VTELEQIEKTLREGGTPAEVTVRQLLAWAGAQRRGYWIVRYIRGELARHGLETIPDFESAYIDSLVRFTLKKEESQIAMTPDEAAKPAELVVDSGASSNSTPIDATQRISKLKAANCELVTVAPDTPVEEVVSKMLMHDFSQLPVMTNPREVKGVVTWASIGSRLALQKSGRVARDFMDTPHPEIPSDTSLFQAIPTIVQHQYVLVRGPDKRITGIVTGTDLSEQFQLLTEPFLLLGEIENYVRDFIAAKFSVEDLRLARDPSDQQRNVDSVADLSFGEYLRLLENPDRWEKLGLRIDRPTFCVSLDRVRRIRNDVMHFDPDGIPPGDVDHLRHFSRFLRQLRNIGAA
jgi:hypothetical protein